MTFSNYRSGIAVIALLLLLASSAAAQDYRGKVQGTVSDDAGVFVSVWNWLGEII